MLGIVLVARYLFGTCINADLLSFFLFSFSFLPPSSIFAFLPFLFFMLTLGWPLVRIGEVFEVRLYAQPIRRVLNPLTLTLTNVKRGKWSER